MINFDAAQTERFWSNVDIRGEDECWLWTAGVRTDGRGRIMIAGRSDTAPRIAYMLVKGEIPPDKPCILHHCKNKLCVNPNHLWAGTYVDAGAGRSGKGSHTKRVALTPEQVKDMRSAYLEGASAYAMASVYGVSPHTIMSAIRGKGAYSKTEYAEEGA